MINLTPLNSQIVHALKEEILSGVLQPNQKISIEELAQRFGVSTTPVRDAIRSLESAGFVIVSPRKSITVACPDEKTFKDLFDLRIALESCAVELAIQRIPAGVLETALQEIRAGLEKYKVSENSEYLKVEKDVHQIVLAYCDNKKLVEIMDQLRDLIAWARGINIHHPKSFDEAATDEHIQIMQHLQDKQTELAVQAIRTHLTSSCERTLTFWTRQG